MWCERCPLRRHRRPCPAHWEGCGETCANASGPLRHDIIAATDREAFRALLPAAHFERERLADEVVTLFIPLSGRWEAWRTHLRPWLDNQTWPRSQTRLVLCDTSQDPDFGMMIQGWAFSRDYPSPRYYTQVVGAPRLADAAPGVRDEVAVSWALSTIYRRMADELATRFVVIVEDDHKPPLDAIERLLRGFDARTAAVSALYRGRWANEWVAWGARPQDLYPCEGPAIPVLGTGFGTIAFRAEAIKGEAFAPAPPAPYDIQFSHRIRAKGGVWKLDRSLLSEHAGTAPLPPLAPAPGFVTESPAIAAQFAEWRRLDALILARDCRGCRTGCGNAECREGRGDQAQGKIASLMHCRKCISALGESSATDPPGEILRLGRN